MSSLVTALEKAALREYTILEGKIKTVVASLETFKAFLFECKMAGFSLCADVMGVDYLEYTEFMPERFAIIYNLLNPKNGERILVKLYIPDATAVPTVTDLWRTAEFHEREVFDLFGIEFSDHPDMRKILTPEDLDGHPLRKDFPLGETPTLFREGRFLDPSAFRAGLSGKDTGLSGWRGGSRIDSSLIPKLPTAIPSKER
jgi:NADH-quinone oxidoreductase subunit C